MDNAQRYAQAIYNAQAEHTTAAQAFFARVREALARRGHEKLLPRIASEYEKLLLRDARREAHEEITPEGERARVLLQLYRKLVTSR